ncbi:hypothetical protein ABZ568_06190 [Streptomyces olindensis]|uniref:Uncharacterized protein n=1 Tax=Streptomyces olindensis TaxID=358823 RepID=A0ABV2XPV1_9ACTN
MDTIVISVIAAANSTSGRCHDRHGADGDHDGAGREFGRKEDMTPPPRVDSDTIRYPIAQLSMMGDEVGKGRPGLRAKVKE